MFHELLGEKTLSLRFSSYGINPHYVKNSLHKVDDLAWNIDMKKLGIQNQLIFLFVIIWEKRNFYLY